MLTGHTKPPQSCEERKPAPPDEEQFNTPTTGSRAMNPNAAVLTSIGNLSMLFIRVSPYTLQVSRYLF